MEGRRGLSKGGPRSLGDGERGGGTPGPSRYAESARAKELWAASALERPTDQALRALEVVPVARGCPTRRAGALDVQGEPGARG